MGGVQVAALAFGGLLAAWFVFAPAIRAATRRDEVRGVYRGLPADRRAVAQPGVGDEIGRDVNVIDQEAA